MVSTAPKRLYDEAFEHRKLQKVEINDFYVEHNVYKVFNVDNKLMKRKCELKTDKNYKFFSDEDIILNAATSATAYTIEKKATKTELIEIFSSISINDIWSAVYYTLDKDASWTEKIVEKIQLMDKAAAMKFVEKNVPTFGKIERNLVGQKILLKSDNNYYTVRDLSIYFDEMDISNPTNASKKSIRKLDVNTIQCLIFNGIKYSLK